jgi:uncharacterized membrane protein
MEAAILLLVLAGLAAFFGGPIFAVVAFVRVRALERRVAELAAGLTGGAVAPGPVRELSREPTGAVSPEPTATLLREPTPASPREPTGAPTPEPTPAAALPAAPALPPPPVPRPAAPTSANRDAFDLESLIAGRWLNRVGLLAVAIGMSYFLKLAIDDGWIGPRGQVAIGLLSGAALVAWSARLAARGMRHFGDGIAGLGAALLYLSLWAGTSYYGFIPPALGFIAMIAVTAAMLAIALGRDSQTVALLAMVGGFLTPALVSTGQNAQVVLFSYLALQDAALLVIAHRRDWRALELPAFALTQLYFWGWYDRFYTDAALVITVASAAGFFALFSALPVIRVRRSGVLRPEQTILVLVNAAAMLIALRVMLWPDHRWTLTLAVLGLSAFHLLLSRATPQAAGEKGAARLLLAGLALTFATVAIPMRLDGHWVTLAWAIEAGILAWSGFRLPLTLLRAAAYVIFAAVALRLLADPIDATTFLWNARLATALVVAASATSAAWFARGAAGWLSTNEKVIIRTLAVAANGLILWALTMEVGLYFQVDRADRAAARGVLLARSLTISLLWTVCATALVLAGVRLKTAALRWQGLALFGVTTAKVFLADLGYLSGFYRVASSVALGVVLLVVSFIYQRSLATTEPRRTGAP